MDRKNFVISGILCGLFIILAVFCFNLSYLRLWEALVDLYNSLIFYFCNIFGLEYGGTITVINLSNVLSFESILPKDFDVFMQNTNKYFSLLFSAQNFNGWLGDLSKNLGNLSKIIVIALPCVVVVFVLFKRLYYRQNNKHNQDTIPLKIFKKLTAKTYYPIKKLVVNYVNFLKEHAWIIKLWLFIWALNLNLISIIVGALSYYLYFCTAFEFTSLWTQVLKLVIDLQVIFQTVPLWVLLILGWLIFERFRKGIAMNKLRHLEAKNCGFIKELPIVSMTCGSMGKKKTTAITDMALSQEVMFRQKAFEILQKCDIKFPCFPWIAFENEVKRCLEHNTVYNLATIKEWVKKKRTRFEKHNNAALQLYGYDYLKHGLKYDDNLKVQSLFDVLETYAQAYFIYVIESSLIVANYSIRTDNQKYDLGNFPLWNYDFFKPKSLNSRFAHILDFDVLRLGKKVLENNPKAGSFEFGVVVISEVGKERGNNLELKEVKKGTIETNQKNDLFNSWLKMCRHSATVDNFPFIKVFTDEQRPESWGADARDLCDVLNIISSGETRLALPFYTIEEMVVEWAFNKFMGWYYNLRYLRGDNTLLVRLLRHIVGAIYSRYVKIYNNYGYSVLKIEKERGSLDGKMKRKTYNVINKKIYTDRFSTDCFSDYFNELAKRSKTALKDYVEYASSKATVAELKQQNSYFINALYKNAEGGD